jgi:hypothetical protein
VEIKRLEQVERRYGADRDHLMRTIMGLDSGLVDLDQENTEVILGVDKVCFALAGCSVALLTSAEQETQEGRRGGTGEPRCASHQEAKGGCGIWYVEPLLSSV